MEVKPKAVGFDTEHTRTTQDRSGGEAGWFNTNAVPSDRHTDQYTRARCVYSQPCTEMFSQYPYFFGINGLDLYRAFIQSPLQNRLTFTHPFIHTLVWRRRYRPCKATASWSGGAVRVKRLAQEHLDTWPGRSRGSNQHSSVARQSFYLLSH